MNRLAFAIIVLIQVAGLTAAQATPGLPSERPSPEKKPDQIKAPLAVECKEAKDAITEHKPWLGSEACGGKPSKPNGAPCRWANDCHGGMCVETPSGGGACIGEMQSSAGCASALGQGNGQARWVASFLNFACTPPHGKRPSQADSPTTDMVMSTCSTIPSRTPLPACANGNAVGHSCAVGQECTSNDMCASERCVKSFPSAVGKCTDSCAASCPAGQNCTGVTSGSQDPLFICVPRGNACR